MNSQVYIAITFTLLAGTLTACQQGPEETQPIKRVVKTELQVDPELLKDPEMAKKIAAAKARFEAMTPEERAKLGAGAESAGAVLPVTLAEAASLPVTLPSGASSTLGKLAPPGTPTVIAAWASWCVPCKIEAKQLAALRTQYADKLNIVYLNIGDPKVEARKGPQFLKQAGAEALGLTMLASEDFKTLTKVPRVSIPRVLPYDRTGKPKYPISGAIVSSGSKDAGDPRLVRAVEDITS